MKRTLLLTIFSLAVCGLHAGNILYVKAGANGDGSSWSNATGNLQQALQQARFGDQIWVATGKYYPTTSTDRNASFVITDGVKLFGGFAGYEPSIDDRNISMNLTILSGEIGSPSIEDNSYTVVYTKNVSAATVIDGFVIVGGSSNVTATKGDRKRCGAGWYNDGSNGVSNPVIRNCVFQNNYGRDGAALYNYAFNGTASPNISNCQFIANRSDLDGGAIYNDAVNGVSSPQIENCSFERNEASYGAAILSVGTNGESMPVLISCHFVNNIAYIRSPNFHSVLEGAGICQAITRNCQYIDSTVAKEQGSDMTEGKR
ncbi:MAG TPA: hypothetical protein PKC76_01900 [Saprospiraceae bacterium]|nr:hypothetical protein [Saprospiraceae bacterium]